MPFLRCRRGVEADHCYTKQADVVLRAEHVTGFISSHWWPRNPGHVILVPNAHHENIYQLPDTLGASLFQASRRIALAMKAAYTCDGVSTRQHNEPAGNQDVWHFHTHVFPRFANDDLYLRTAERTLSTPRQRLPFAQKLKIALDSAEFGE